MTSLTWPKSNQARWSSTANRSISSRLVSEVRDALRGLAAEKRIDIDLEMDPALTAANLDPSKFKQVLFNYLSNAIKFTPEGGKVTIRTATEEVTTSGSKSKTPASASDPRTSGACSASSSQLDARHREEACRGPDSASPSPSASSRRKRGSVAVRSVFGQGSVFAADVARGSQAPPISPKDAGGSGNLPTTMESRPRILVIEDNPREREWLIATLTRANFSVEAAANGADAISLSRRKSFDAITLDLLLPDSSGWEVLGRSAPMN